MMELILTTSYVHLYEGMFWVYCEVLCMLHSRWGIENEKKNLHTALKNLTYRIHYQTNRNVTSDKC